jgi:hypothetical protein
VQYSYQPPRDGRFEQEEESARERREHESQRDVRVSQGDMDSGVADKREFYQNDRDQDGSTMPAQHVPQLISSANRTSVLTGGISTLPAAVPSPVGAASASATATSTLPAMGGNAAPAFHPNDKPTAAGAPAISAPLTGAAPAAGSAAMDTA